MIKIIFVCHGNICRSPMAKFMMLDMIKKASKIDEYEIDSAATHDDEIGNDMYGPAKEILNKHKIPYTKHRAKRFTKEDVNYFDYIIALDKYNLEDLLEVVPKEKCHLLLNYANKDCSVSDPWYTRDFEKAYQDIQEGLDAFWLYLQNDK